MPTNETIKSKSEAGIYVYNSEFCIYVFHSDS